MKKRVITIIAVVLMLLTISGCSQAIRVSHNISQNADNFNVTRRLTVMNMRTDKIVMTMTGKMSIQNEGNDELSVIVEIDRKKGIYQKHMVYLNEWTMYTVEDVSGVSVSKYDYEIEFMPQMITPIHFKASEIVQDIQDVLEE